MSINCTERTLSLFMALLMITTAFIPVVSAMGTTNNYTFTKHGTVESEWNWAQPVSWMNYTSSSFDYDPVMVERYDIGTEPIFTYSTPQMVSGVATLGSEWNWSVDGWDGWSHTAYRTLTFRPGMRPISSCTEYGPVIVGDHGEYGADFHLYGDAMRASVEHEFIDPSGVGWNSLTLVGRVPGTNHPWGRWMTIEVNNQIVYSESGFSSSDPENLIPKEFHADFPQSDNVRVKISHGQEQAWN
ncbi:MAG: hypothetical protein KAW93_00120, partial [Methanogenium sp.]|nr:hypothetical protein [Methanogenium sp.]